MFIQLQPQYLTIWELELELFAIEHRIILVDNAMVIGTDDNDVRGVVVLRTGEVVDMVGLERGFISGFYLSHVRDKDVVTFLLCQDGCAHAALGSAQYDYSHNVGVLIYPPSRSPCFREAGRRLR